MTHGVVLGMTGSGKTGLTMVLIEEALASGVPVVMIDIKGDLANLLLSFPKIEAASFEPFVDADAAAREGKSAAELADGLAKRQREGLASWGLGEADLVAFRAKTKLRVVTPGAKHGEPLNVLSALSVRSALWDVDDEAALDQLSSGISLVLRLAGRDGDPQGRDHVVLSALALRRIQRGEAAPLEALLRDVLSPPLDRIGVMAFEEFLPPKEQQSLAQALNTLFASPRLQAWQGGAPLDVASWLKLAPPSGPGGEAQTPAVIVSVAHLDDDERQLVLGLLLDEILSYVRGLAGTSSLRALVVFDEVFGFLPPHPHNPPTKKPLLALLKQARAFGVGVVLATQNPMDLDYKALSNAGLWMIGRLQTDADRERVAEALAGSVGGFGELDRGAVETVLKGLPSRHFLVRDAHATPSAAVVESRWAMSWLRGPMTRAEIARLVPKPATAVSSPASAGVPAPAATAASESALASPTAASRGSATSSLESAPPAPAGWSTLFGHARVGGAPRYVPFVAATVAIHLRDADLGLGLERRATLTVPFDASGRPDTGRATMVDPQVLTGAAVPGATFDALPESVRTKKNAQAVERQLKTFVGSTFPILLDVHRGLGLYRGESEPPEAFAARCVEVAARQAAQAEQELLAKYAPQLAKLSTKRDAAARELDAAQRAEAAAPSDLGAALVSVALGRSVGGKLASARNKASSQLAKASEALAKIDADLRAELSRRDTEIFALRAEVSRAASGITNERFVPKKGDVELVSVGLAWSPTAG